MPVLPKVQVPTRAEARCESSRNIGCFSQMKEAIMKLFCHRPESRYGATDPAAHARRIVEQNSNVRGLVNQAQFKGQIPQNAPGLGQTQLVSQNPQLPTMGQIPQNSMSQGPIQPGQAPLTAVQGQPIQNNPQSGLTSLMTPQNLAMGAAALAPIAAGLGLSPGQIANRLAQSQVPGVSVTPRSGETGEETGQHESSESTGGESFDDDNTDS